eukprot:3199886-Rhodomonas_salina.1
MPKSIKAMRPSCSTSRFLVPDTAQSHHKTKQKTSWHTTCTRHVVAFGAHVITHRALQQLTIASYHSSIPPHGGGVIPGMDVGVERAAPHHAAGAGCGGGGGGGGGGEQEGER